MTKKTYLSIKATPDVHEIADLLAEATREAVNGSGLILGQGRHRGFKSDVVCELVRRGAATLLADIKRGDLGFLQERH